MLVRYRSWRHRPPHRVSCRLLRGTDRVAVLEGLYRDSTWVFTVPDEPGWDRCQLLLDGQVVVATQDRPVVGAVDVGEAAVPARPPIAVDESTAQQEWFAEGADDGTVWDVLVVGQGMGGGVLHAALTTALARSGRHLDVLGLEAGPLLFPTHVANLPRVSFGRNTGGTPTMWSSLDTFGTPPAPPPHWAGYEVFALGGRSLYWGGLAPRIADRELARWPAAVRDDLLGPLPSGTGYYARAEALLGVGSPAEGGLGRRAARLLDDVVGGRNRLAPVAMTRPRRRSWRVPGGLFSTAELLLDQRLGRRTDGGFGPPFIHLGELVVGLERRNLGGWLVHTVRLRDGARSIRRARQVVLCAGTVETPRLVRGSRLAGAPDLVGRGLSEHPIAYRHFQVPPDSPFHDMDDSADLLSEPHDDERDWNLHLELGSDAVLARLPYVGDGATVVSGGHVAGQLVILGRTDLDDTAGLQFGAEPWLELDDPDGPTLPAVTLGFRPAPVPGEWAGVAQQLVEALRARDLPEGQSGSALVESRPGAVSHEVGTMRLGDGAATAVVDHDLQVFGCPGLYVCDNSVFPTSPAANPSLTLAALAVRLADHLLGS